LLRLFEPSYDGLLPDVIGEGIARQINRGEIEITTADLDHLIALYDAAIRSMDGTFGELVDALHEAGLYDRSMIIFTSDHGEEYGERGRVAHHGTNLYDEAVRVPLIVKPPSALPWVPAVVKAQVRSVDILPTVLDVAGIAPHEHFEGTSLKGALLGGPQLPLPAVSQIRGHRQVSLRDGGWKLIRKPRGTRLFDLHRDPEERRNVARGHRDVIAQLDSILDPILDSRPDRETAYDPTDEEVEQLRALGYIE
jgi:arylsulfatase A-like enzyme